MKKLLPLLLLVAAVALAIYGAQLYQEATASISLLGLDIEASDKGSQQNAFLFLGLAVLCGVGSVVLWRRS
jgi:LPXTG-motif cell wall-anchored protein